MSTVDAIRRNVWVNPEMTRNDKRPIKYPPIDRSNPIFILFTDLKNGYAQSDKPTIFSMIIQRILS